MGFDSTVDDLSTVYEGAGNGDERYTSVEEHVDSFGNVVLARKA